MTTRCSSTAAPQTPWYFYNFPRSIDREDAYLATDFRSITPADAKFSHFSFGKVINPDTQWIAFNPRDNKRLCESQGESVDVGHNCLFFEVVDLKRLRPIYWPLNFTANVHKANWVFSTSLTPIDPSWEKPIEQALRICENGDYSHKLELFSKTLNPWRDIAVPVKLEQEGKTISADVVFVSQPDPKAYIFQSNISADTRLRAVRDILEKRNPIATIAIIQRFDWSSWKTLHKLPHHASDDESHVPRPINRLILVFHGMGQKLSSTYQRFNFIYAVDRLQFGISKLAATPAVRRQIHEDANFLVLAVNWRQDIRFDSDVSLEDITVEAMWGMRRLLADAILDVPYYMSEHHKKTMLDAAAKEANRLYDLVLKHHPNFKDTGQVNILGHSLGSLIVAEILTLQPASSSDPGAMLRFNTQNCFMTGSPLGLFLLLNREQLISRASRSVEDVSTYGCLAAKNIYNIVNPSDMFCFLLSPMVRGSGKRFKPALLPRVAEDGNIIVQEPSKKHFGRFWKRASSFIRKNKNPADRSLPMGEENLQPTSSMYELNANGQIDWMIIAPSRGIQSQYLSVFTAHFNYWSSLDLARFLAIECGQ